MSTGRRTLMGEEDLQRSVLDAIAKLGLHGMHLRPGRLAGEGPVPAEPAELSGYARAALAAERRTGSGGSRWRTPVEGNGGKGYPDITVWGEVDPAPVCPCGCPPQPAVMWRELKGPRGVLSPEQEQRLGELERAGANVGIWTPEHWRDGRALRELQALRRPARRRENR